MSYTGKHKMGPAHHARPPRSPASPLTLAVCFGVSPHETCLLPVARVILKGRHEKIQVTDTPPAMGAITWEHTEESRELTGLQQLVGDMLEETECSRLLVMGWLDSPFTWAPLAALGRVSFLDLRNWCSLYTEEGHEWRTHSWPTAIDHLLVEVAQRIQTINENFVPRSIRMHIPTSSTRIGYIRSAVVALLRHPQSGYLVTKTPLCTTLMGPRLSQHVPEDPPPQNEQPPALPGAQSLKEMDWTDVRPLEPSYAFSGLCLSFCSSRDLKAEASRPERFTTRVDPSLPREIAGYLDSLSPSMIQGFDFFYATPSMSLVKVKRGWMGASNEGYSQFDLWIIDFEGFQHKVEKGKADVFRKIEADCRKSFIEFLRSMDFKILM